MAHPMVEQLRFTRSEFVRCFDGVTAEEAVVRHGQMNCISWMVGHLAGQEQRYWVYSGRGLVVRPELNDLVGYGKPATTPPLDEMWAIWHDVTAAADPFLDSLTAEQLTTHFDRDGGNYPESIGTMLYRNIYHYWFHLGEGHAVRQMLGHQDLPQFVGNMASALYRG